MDTREILQKYVTANGIKLTYIASQTGMTTDQVSKSLRKERNLSADEFVKVCKVLKIPFDYFIGSEQAATKDVS